MNESPSTISKVAEVEATRILASGEARMDGGIILEAPDLSSSTVSGIRTM